MSDSFVRVGQASSDCGNGKISIAEHKVIAQEFINEVNSYYDMFLELEPPKRFGKAHDLFSEAMEHHLNSATFLQSYIDADDIEEMIGYLNKATDEMNLGTEYLGKSTEQINELAE